MPLVNKLSLHYFLIQMVYSEYVKLRILYHYNMGFKPYTISKKLLEEEGIKVSKVGVMKFLKVYLATGTTQRRSGSGRPSKITQHVRELVDAQMEKDDETTATQLHRMLLNNQPLGTRSAYNTIIEDPGSPFAATFQCIIYFLFTSFIFYRLYLWYTSFLLFQTITNRKNNSFAVY